MILLLILLTVGTSATLLTHLCSRDYNRIANTLFTGIFASIVIIIVISATLGTSYNSYLDIRARYDATINQYRGAVKMYSDHAVLDLEKAALTDFKYQGYQENVASIIKDLRQEIVGYNLLFIRKKTLNNNPMFNWLIIGPDDDMKVINIIE